MSKKQYQYCMTADQRSVMKGVRMLPSGSVDVPPDGQLNVVQISPLQLTTDLQAAEQMLSSELEAYVKSEPNDPLLDVSMNSRAESISTSPLSSKGPSRQESTVLSPVNSSEEPLIPSYWAINWHDALSGKKVPQMKELMRLSDFTAEGREGPKAVCSSKDASCKAMKRPFQRAGKSGSLQMSAEDGPSNFCQICSEQLSSEEEYKQHIKQHKRGKSTRYVDGERASKAGYRCNLCNQSFSAGYTLKKHIRVHTREKPFSCDLCSERFSQWGNLRLHIQRHLGINPYRCPYCDKAYIAPSKLEVHIRGHTNERPYPCEICYSTFKSNDDLRKHMMIHANYKPFTCWLCHKSFMQPSKLKQHMKEKHMMDVDISKKDVTDKGVEYEIKILPGNE